MKKNLFTLLIVCAVPALAVAQLKVNAYGQTALGSDVPTLYEAYTDKLNVYSDTSSDSCGISLKNGLNNPFRIFNKGSYGYIGNFNSLGTQFCGLKMSSSGILISSSFSYLLPRLKPKDSGLAALTVGSYSYPAIAASGQSASYGIVSVYSYSQTGICYSAYYTNSSDGTSVRNFYVKGDGSVYAKNGLIQSSDISKKEDVALLSSRSALNSLTSLHGVSFSYKEEQLAAESGKLSAASRSLNADEVLPEMDEEQRKAYESMERIPDEVLAKMNEERSRKRIGLIAQEVEEVVPEVVRTLPDGSKGIMYTDLIGLIVEGMKEMNTRIDSLEKTVNFYKSLISFTGTVSEAGLLPSVQLESSQAEGSNESVTKIASSLTGQVLLYQNVPNPFSASTEIVYAVPEGIENGMICIYDLNGQLLKQYTLASLAGKITIQGDEFDAGTYIYTLNSAGQVLASRKMVKS